MKDDGMSHTVIYNLMLKLSMCTVLCVVLLTMGCGRKGDLLPPDAAVPSPVSNLRVVQKGELFELSWKRAAQGRPESAGEELARFRVLRREVLPAGEDCPNCPYQPVGEVDLEQPKGTGRRGDTYIFRDTGVRSGATYQYTVVALNRDGVPSPASNAVRKKKLPPPPPSPLRIRATETDLLLTWGFQPLPEDALLVGYNIYRKSNEGPFILLTPEPLADFRYRDVSVQPGVQYRYRVRAVSDLEGQVFESGPSDEATGLIPLTD